MGMHLNKEVLPPDIYCMHGTLEMFTINKLKKKKKKKINQTNRILQSDDQKVNKQKEG